jgi:arginase
MRELIVAGVPSSAGGHFAGMEKAPASLRNHGLIEELRRGDIDVEDLGDIDGRVFQVDTMHTEARNVDGVAATIIQVGKLTDTLVARKTPFLIVGGDCTISIGVIAAFQRARKRFGVLYIDGHTDLNTPEDSTSGVLDSMVTAQLFGFGSTRLDAALNHSERLSKDQIVYFGYDPRRIGGAEVDLLKQIGAEGLTVQEVNADCAKALGKAFHVLSAYDYMLVHLDIDVLHFPDFPLINFPEYHGEGLSFDTLKQTLCAAFTHPKFAGCVLTEVNPDHDPSGDFCRQLISLIATAANASNHHSPRATIGH